MDVCPSRFVPKNVFEERFLLTPDIFYYFLSISPRRRKHAFTHWWVSALDGTGCQESSWAVTLARLCSIVIMATSVSRSTPPSARWYTTHNKVCWLKAEGRQCQITPKLSSWTNCTAGIRKHAFLILGWTVPLMAHLSSNQYGRSGSSCIKAVFAIIQDQMKEVIEAWSSSPCRFLLWPKWRFFTESCVTWLNVRCLVRLFFATYIYIFFSPFARLNKVLVYRSLSRQHQKFVIRQ